MAVRLLKCCLIVLVAVPVAVGSSSHVRADVITYFGEDLYSPDVNPVDRTVPAGGNAETARNLFLANTVNAGEQDFADYVLDFLTLNDVPFGTHTADLTGSGRVVGVDDGRFPTSGIVYLESPQTLGTSQLFTVSFDEPVSAFGFYGTDFGYLSSGSLGAQVRVELTKTDFSKVTMDIPHSRSTDENYRGALIFWGFTDLADDYRSARFFTAGVNPGDIIGVDDMIIAEATAVPEPSTFAVAGLATLIGLWTVRRRHRAGARPPGGKS